MQMSSIPWRRCTAEFLGTLILTFAVLGSIVQQTPTSIIAGLTLLLLVYLFGGISGAHVNPAVTAGLWIVKKISSMEASYYIVSQCLGALAAQVLFAGFIGQLPPSLSITTLEWMPAVGEAFGAFLLVLGVSAVVFHQVHRAAGGLVIGMALFIGILSASLLSNGVLNPSVALGIRTFSLPYL
ncbi:MAG: aquaporin, partial [Candidatus Peribacteraceae bacterium]|nr:aquaporin [Candidatus Peribacteraceae bacterium]